jgi:NAD(P)-dependent dehydrogenase (short-subunit alcohol dehydrogenase family)
MANRLANKVALITGGARGQGAAEGRLFVNEGASVVLTDVLDKDGERLAAELNRGSTKERAVYLHLDVSKAADWDRAVSAAERQFGGLDILVNNAGILSLAGIEQTSEEEWQQVIDINQKGVWLGMKAVVSAMRKRSGGSIINISSIYGLIGSGGSAAYHASKGAVRLLTKTAALEFAGDKIRVNSVHPGIITTPMVEAIDRELRAGILSLVPARREGRPEEIAYGVLFLASEESSYMTGAELVIDGGYTAA